MRYTVRLFGPAREALGSGSATVEVDGPATAGQVLAALAEAHPALGPWVPRSRVAVDGAYVAAESPVGSGAEIAIIPPVGGG